MTKPIGKRHIIRSHYPKYPTEADTMKLIKSLKPEQVFVYTGTYHEQRVLTEAEAQRLYFYKNELQVLPERPSGGEAHTERGRVDGPLPTKAAAHLALISAAERYAGRQSEDTFMLLANAMATARAVKLY